MNRFVEWMYKWHDGEETELCVFDMCDSSPPR